MVVKHPTYCTLARINPFYHQGKRKITVLSYALTEMLPLLVKCIDYVGDRCHKRFSVVATLSNILFFFCAELCSTANFSRVHGEVQHKHSPTNHSLVITTFSCNKSNGYTLQGPDHLLCESGAFNGTLPTCELVYCENPPSLQYGSVNTSSSSSGARMKFGTELVYICENGFDMKGDNGTACSLNGTWTKLLAECVPQPIDRSKPSNKTLIVIVVSLVVLGVIILAVLVVIIIKRKRAKTSGKRVRVDLCVQLKAIFSEFH